MTQKKISTNRTGVRYREHASRKHGITQDRLYFIRYKVDGRTREESVGWSSEGMSLDEAAAIRASLIANKREGKGHRTLEEARQLDKQRREREAEAEREREAEVERLEALRFSNVFNRMMAERTDMKDRANPVSLHRKWIQPCLGDKRLDEIVLFDLERIKQAMEAEGLSVKTIANMKAVVRMVYSYAAEHGLYKGEAPTRYFLRRIKEDNRRQRYLEPSEADALLRELKQTSTITYRLALVSLSTGMRLGEVTALRWMHLTGDSILITDPKNGESRHVPMTPELKDLFREMRAELPVERAKAARRGQFPLRDSKPESLVFPPHKRDTKSETIVSVPKAFSRAVEKLGLNQGIEDRRLRVVFHSLRHSAASWMVNAGVTIPTIARILGHKTLQMTMRYSHLGDDAVSDAMAALSAARRKGSVLAFDEQAGAE